MRVPILDDEEDVREMLRELPELEGFEVYTARDAQDALSKVAAEPPCAVVLLRRPPRRGRRDATVVPKPIDGVRLLSLVRAACAAAG